MAAQLSKTVLQMGETRFSTVNLTLKSVHEIYNKLYDKLQARGEEACMDNIAPDLLDFFGLLSRAFLCSTTGTGRRQIYHTESSLPLE